MGRPSYYFGWSFGFLLVAIALNVEGSASFERSPRGGLGVPAKHFIEAVAGALGVGGGDPILEAVGLGLEAEPLDSFLAGAAVGELAGERKFVPNKNHLE